MDSHKWGVCRYDFQGYEPKPSDLVIFDTYAQAAHYYLDHCINKDTLYPDKDMWIVWIQEDCIRQFDQLTPNIKSEIVQVNY